MHRAQIITIGDRGTGPATQLRASDCTVPEEERGSILSAGRTVSARLLLCVLLCVPL